MAIERHLTLNFANSQVVETAPVRRNVYHSGAYFDYYHRLSLPVKYSLSSFSSSPQMSKSQEVDESSPSDQVNASQTSHEPRPHLTSYLVFFFMQAALTVLSWYCYVHPRQLPWFDTDDDHTTIRSGINSLFSGWQSAAALPAQNIYSAVSSMEEKVVRNDLNCLDSIMKPVFDFFHLGMMLKVAFLALIVLRTVGHSAITVSGGLSSEHPLRIGLISTVSLTTDTADTRGKVYHERRLQSDMIVRLEQLYKVPWGYVASPNLLIPLPIEELNSTTKVEYESDVLSFRHDCRWQAPDDYSGDIARIGNKTWSARISSNATDVSGSGHVSLGSSIIFLLPEDDNSSSDSVYLFLGANTTIPSGFNSTSNNTWINLSNRPTIYNRDGYTSRYATLRSLRAPLATLLVCHPDLKLLSRRVHLHPNANRTEPDITIKSDANVPSPSNIDLQAARNLFAIILNTTTSSEDADDFIPGIMNINEVSGNMLLDGFGVDDETKVSFSPFDIKTIGQNVDKYTLSALKPFTSGYQGKIPKQRRMYARNVTAVLTGQGLALQTSLPFAILNTVLFSVLGIVLAVLAYPKRVL
ncbi:hypothetical protein AGABI2DRAFT_179499 [Agaricus bisporus var. bisporus H97]|uniref:hypothetical protein n=1 Tax=Agaricus bisporus var. bisporus (strain H97 / ATCC MYA-4626 / FGSC 10389) TaxID=936046 RepID=UPI00029F65BC|nr:hypothetical protein AGABI2DRAFT_179499 [Agaricus bisporus var. bisporus H97]EKV46100.1 hypothetical protein AGABI2DRAFT_179499 [Agaricus bisporus var. bisporus H97]